MTALTLGICNYNTPELIKNAILSFKKFNPGDYDFLVAENSTDEASLPFLIQNKIPYIRNVGMSHSLGVDVLLSNCKTKYLLLCDSDVLFLRNIDEVFQMFKRSRSAAGGVIQGDRGGKILHNRICPWFCFIDVEQIRRAGIKYTDPEKLMKDWEVKGLRVYDVGATFLEEIHSHGLSSVSFTELIQNMYIIHFEGMSWRKNHPHYQALALEVEKLYKDEVKAHFRDL